MTQAFSFAVMVLVIAIIIWKRPFESYEKTLEQMEIQEPQTYLSYVRPPERLPVEFYVKTGWDILGMIGFVFMVLFCNATMAGEMVYGNKEETGLVIAVMVLWNLFSFLLGRAIWKSFQRKRVLCVKLDNHHISFGNRLILYRNILAIRYDAIKKTVHYPRRLPRIHFEHYIIIQDVYGEEIQLKTNELKQHCYAEIINCCVYHNPRIQIDRVVKDTLVNGKIPRIYVSREKEYTMRSNRY